MIKAGAPVTVDLVAVKMTDQIINNTRELVAYVCCDDYKKLPIEANVREPSAKSGPYKDMLDTLHNAPQKFFENNLGISVIATTITDQGVHSGKHRVSLFFNSGTGILNGGHTQLAILDAKHAGALLADAYVRVTIRSAAGVNEERIAEIAAAQNSSTPVKPYSLAEKRGLFIKLSQGLEASFEKRIVWHEGRDVGGTPGLTATDLIAYLNVFNIFSYMSEISPGLGQPKESATGKGSVFSRWEKLTGNDLANFERLYPLANDIIRLVEFIQMNFHDFHSKMGMLSIVGDTQGKANPLVFCGQTPKYVIPRQMLFPLLAAFRANVFFDSVKKRIGWIADNEKLFRDHNAELCQAIKQTFQANGKEINRISKDALIWETLYSRLRTHVQAAAAMPGHVNFKEYPVQ